MVKFYHKFILGLVTLGLFLFSVACDNDNGVSSDVSTITGTITFQNIAMWPDSGEVQITIFPQNVWTAMGPIGPPQNANTPVILTKDVTVSQYNYFISDLPEGEYSAIAVGWRHPNENLPAERRTAVLGVYLSGSNAVSTGLMIPGSPFNGPLPSVITLEKGKDLANVSFTADFANILLFFPPGP